MKVLLINPPIKNIKGPELPAFIRENEGHFPPLGLLYIAAYLLENLDCAVKILDAPVDNCSYRDIAQIVSRFCPDVVGISTYTTNLIDTILVVNTVKKIRPQAHVCLGGPHINVFAQEAINLDGVDSVVSGDGEATFTELVRCLVQKTDPLSVSGLILKRGRKCIPTQPRTNLLDLDNLPLPARSLIDIKKYYSILGQKPLMATMVSSRGCPYQCTFCSTPKGFYRTRSAESILAEIRHCLNLGIEEIHFVDDVFNVDTQRLEKLCSLIIAGNLKVKWSFRGRVDKISKALLVRLKQAGCYRIHFGVEESTEEGLQELKKGITIAQITQAFQWAQEAGIDTVGYFLIGTPAQKDKAAVLQAINFAKSLKPSFALFNILTPYPDTELYQTGLKKGILSTDYWRQFSISPGLDFQPRLWTEWFCQKELFSLLRHAYRSFYFRPEFIWQVLRNQKNLTTFKQRLKAGLQMLR